MNEQNKTNIHDRVGHLTKKFQDEINRFTRAKFEEHSQNLAFAKSEKEKIQQKYGINPADLEKGCVYFVGSGQKQRIYLSENEGEFFTVAIGENDLTFKQFLRKEDITISGKPEVFFKTKEHAKEFSSWENNSSDLFNYSLIDSFIYEITKREITKSGKKYNDYYYDKLRSLARCSYMPDYKRVDQIAEHLASFIVKGEDNVKLKAKESQEIFFKIVDMKRQINEKFGYLWWCVIFPMLLSVIYLLTK
tara:strand:- start:47452 stop:48195 length:744 start_codon:yes stop_codon:yes gene_type:complete